jgi:hypothetical protein
MNSIIESEPQSAPRKSMMYIEKWDEMPVICPDPLNLDEVLESCYSLKRNRELTTNDCAEILSFDPEALTALREVMTRYYKWSAEQRAKHFPHAYPFVGREEPSQKVQTSAP